MKSLIRWDLWQRRSYIMWWTIGIVGFIAMELSFYPAFKNQGQQLNQTLSQIPEAAKALIGRVDYASPTGYITSQVFTLVLPILLIILAISLGSSIIAREEREGTIELLLSRPISRSQLLAAKALVGLAILLIVGLVGFVVTTGIARAVGIHVGTIRVLQTFGMAVLMSLCFGALALAITALSQRTRRASVGLASLMAFGSYLLSGLSQVVKGLLWPAKILPFYHYRPAELLTGHLIWSDVVYFVAVIVTLGIISWLAFRKRDLGQN